MEQELENTEVLETEEMEDQEFASLPDVSDYHEVTEEETSDGNYKYLVGGAIGSLVTVAAVKGYQKFIQPKASKAFEGLKKKLKGKKAKDDAIDANVVEETEED